MKKFIPLSAIKNFNFKVYHSAAPFPHHASDSFLTPQGFESLRKDFPALDLFEKSVGNYRGPQRPHDRFLLSFERSLYHDKTYRGKGLALRKNLSKNWQGFIKEIEGKPYRSFIKKILGTGRFKIHCEWHMGFKGSEVSPHKDAPFRLGSHLFYFNTREDWDPSWGGEALLLGNKIKGSSDQAPEFEDFKKILNVPAVGNQSLLFHNSASAWHGVRPLKCPQNKYRRLFMVIFVRPDFEGLYPKLQPIWRVLASRIKRRFSR
jgi:hypothetical protein